MKPGAGPYKIPEPMRLYIIKRLEKDRRRLKMSKQKFSRHLGFTQVFISQVEHCRRGMGLIAFIKVSKQLKWDLNRFKEYVEVEK